MSEFWGPEHVSELPELEALHVPMDEWSDMEGVEFRLMRESLGLSAPELGTFLGVTERTVRRWEKSPQVPPSAAAGLGFLLAETTMWEKRLCAGAEAVVHADGWRLLHGRPLPESWWRVIVGVALRRNPMLAVHEVDLAKRSSHPR